MPTDDVRLTDLELRYMRLERTVEELSGVIADQQKTIDRLVAELRSVASRVEPPQIHRGDAAEQDPGDKPPHY